MNYQQTLQFLYAQLPMFHRIGPAAYKANLDNTIALAQHFSHPEKKIKTIHVAGTNGKGSVSHMMASVFYEAGYKTGLCTSPHLKDFRERFRINGKMISQQYVADFVSKNMKFFEELKPSFFEMTIAMAFCYFAENQVDIAIIETGLGGRLDSTNIITPQLSVITNVGLDHTNLLGTTVKEIAIEKAGIIKPGVPVVIGKSTHETRPVFIQKAKEYESPIYFAHERYQIKDPVVRVIKGENILSGVLIKDTTQIPIESPLTASYQWENIITLTQAIDVINHDEKFSVSHEAYHKGLKNVVKNTGIKGRWQVLSQNPLTICDTGHNEDGISAIIENIRLTPHEKLHFVLGMMNDKELNDIMKLLPHKNTTYYYCKPDVPRGLDVKILQKAGEKHGLTGKAYVDVQSAMKEARQRAGAHDLIFVGGSTFVVAEII